MSSFLNIAAIRICTEAEGPGKRFALWVQGCLQRCPDCCNPNMQELKVSHIIEVQDLFNLILESKNKFDIEGVSFIGGEPLLQVEGLKELALLCQKENLSVLCFTGFSYSKIKDSKDKNLIELLNNIDILVDGLFDKDQFDTERDWVGSKNQNVIFLSDKYKSGIEFEKSSRSIEIRISEKDLLINGWPFL